MSGRILPNIEHKQPVLPSDKAEEALVLGALYCDLALYDEISMYISSDECFADMAHRQIWRCLESEAQKGNKKPDPPSIAAAVTAVTPEELGKLLTDIELLGAQVVNIKSHAEALQEYYFRRKAILRARRLMVELSNVNGTVSKDIIYQTSLEFSDLIEQADAKSQLLMPKDFVQARKVCMNDRESRGRILTGMPFLDKKLHGGGFLPGKVSVLCGRPQMMKTVVRLDWTKYWCENDVGVLNLCIEPGVDDDMDRLDAMNTGISIKELKNPGAWPDNDPRLGMVLKSQETIAGWPMAMDDSRKISLLDLPLLVRRIRRSQQVSIITIDTFAKLAGITTERNVTESINYWLKRVDDIAKECDTHMLLITHLNRKLEERTDKRPRLSDIKQSGSYEEDVDQVFAVWRPQIYKQTLPFDYQELIILKQKDGPAGPDVSTWNRVNKSILKLENFTDTNPYKP